MNKLITSALLFMPMAASAQLDVYGVNSMKNSNLGTKELGDTASSVVNIVLGFLGILATLIILMGGFKWMTSQGNTDKVDEAKKLIGAGIVGLVIILTAYAISRFVLTSLQNETI
ncbi:hypothetical protein HOB10_05295 [Candidatus Parcubacteria bacterium]|jgi:hypothetical protein|nr:hypothetical protein [Candidatus Parcubacteria bacterium]